MGRRRGGKSSVLRKLRQRAAAGIAAALGPDAARSPEAPRESESDVAALVDCLGDMVLVLDEDTIAYANAAMVELLGAPREAIVGSSIRRWLAEPSQTLALRQLARGNAVLELVRVDNDLVQLRVDAPRVVTFGGRGALLLVGQRNPLRSPELFDRLIVINRMTTLGTLVAGLGEELRGGLAAVSDNVEELSETLRRHLDRQPAGADHEHLIEVLDTVTFGADQLKVVVDEIGKLAAHDESDLHLLDIGALVRSSIRLARRDLGGRARLVERYLPGLPLVWGNPIRLSQVVLNLVLNAVQALPEDASPDSHHILIEVGVDAVGDPLLAVSDTGHGIQDGVLGQLFDPLFSTKPSGVGTGLGLYLSNEIIRELGGQIDLDTEDGRGTTFFVTLPAADLSRRVPPKPH